MDAGNLKDNDQNMEEMLKRYGLGKLGRKNHGRPTTPNGFDYVQPVSFLGNYAHRINLDDINKDITNSMYLGSKGSATLRRDIYSKYNIKAIINCTNRVPCCHRRDSNSNDVRYCRIPINDVEGADILTYLEGATTFLHTMLSSDSCSVLIHCEAGVSRSATVVIAYLMRFHGLSRDEAYVLCKKSRPMIYPNQGFWKQLHIFELRLKEIGEQKESKEKTTLTDACTFDKAWALQTSASYSTCVDLPHMESMFNHSDSWLQFLKEKERILSNEEIRKHFLFVCLDFIWGRGVLPVDLEWFGFVCCQLYEKRRPNNDNKNKNIFEEANDMLIESNSEFNSFWAGEVYDFQIQLYRQYMKKAQDEDC